MLSVMFHVKLFSGFKLNLVLASTLKVGWVQFWYVKVQCRCATGWTIAVLCLDSRRGDS
jgi:hypothetical protein